MDNLELKDIFHEDVNEEVPDNQDEFLKDTSNVEEEFLFGDDYGSSNTSMKQNTLIDEFLKSRGVENTTIKILDEQEQEKEVNFYDLTKEEQLEILNSSDPVDDENLEDSEIELLNLIRTNNLTPEEFLNQYKESIIAEMQQGQEPSYEIDNYDDNELFLLDLKNKYDLTDEELQAELEKELSNPELFAKKTGKLRSEYKESEDQYNAAEAKQIENNRINEYNQFVDVMDKVATNVEDFHGVYLEDFEKSETLSYLLELDEAGVSKFSKELNDPKKLFEAAWYLRYGKEAFLALENAYEVEIAKLKNVTKDKPRVVVQDSKKQIKNINELY